MSENTLNQNNENEEELESEVYTLTDENGDEHDFELLAQAEIEGVTYLAMIPVEEQDEEAEILN